MPGWEERAEERRENKRRPKEVQMRRTKEDPRGILPDPYSEAHRYRCRCRRTRAAPLHQAKYAEAVMTGGADGNWDRRRCARQSRAKAKSKGGAGQGETDRGFSAWLTQKMAYYIIIIISIVIIIVISVIINVLRLMLATTCQTCVL
ncbi:hypothetical protein L209DRAFT_760789 [Thermothelomyces heterothallicus CBS 203.75]